MQCANILAGLKRVCLREMSNKELISRIFKYDSEDNVVAALYKIGLLILVPLVIIFFFLRTDMALNHLIKGGYSCAFKAATGYNCPGCGGTRASIYLARFMFRDSFMMNASVPVFAMLYIFFMMKETLHKAFGFRGISEKQVYVLISIFVGVVLVRWVVCNFFIIL